MSKPALTVRRQGNAVTVFVDPQTDRPISTSSFNDTPVGGFPKVYSMQEVRAAFPAYEVQFVDPPAVVTPEADAYAVPDEEVEKVDQAGKAHMLRVAAKHGKKVAVPAGTVPTQPTVPCYVTESQAITIPSSFLPPQVEQELSIMLSKRQVATGATRKQLDAEINHVFNFLGRLEPAVKPILRALSDRYREQANEEY